MNTFLKIILGLLIIIFIVFTASFFVASYFVSFRGKYYLEDYLSKILDKPVKVSSVKLTFPLTIFVDDINCNDFFVDYLKLSFFPQDILFRSFDVNIKIGKTDLRFNKNSLPAKVSLKKKKICRKEEISRKTI